MRYCGSHLTFTPRLSPWNRFAVVSVFLSFCLSFFLFRDARLWQVYNILFNIEMRQFHVVICLLDNLYDVPSLSPLVSVCKYACCIMLFMLWYFSSQKSEKVNIAARCSSSGWRWFNGSWSKEATEINILCKAEAEAAVWVGECRVRKLKNKHLLLQVIDFQRPKTFCM